MISLLLALIPAFTLTYTIPQPVTIEATVTAYSELDSCHTGESCLMANGERAYVGAAACPRFMELGTMIEIDGTTYICADRTALRYDGRFDIFMGYQQEAYEQAIRYGVQKKIITIK